MDVREAADEFIASTKKLRPLTREGYKQKLNIFIEYCEERGISLEAVRNKVVDNFLDYLSEHHKPHKAHKEHISDVTLAGYVRVIRLFMNWCAEDEQYEEYVKPIVVKRIKLPKIEQKIIETFTPEQIKSLFKVCEKEESDHLRLRDRCILMILLDTGIRADELCTLLLKNTHIQPDDPHIKVMGKGRKEREVGLSEGTRRELRKYMREYRKDGEYTFINRYGKPLTVFGLDQVIRRLGEWAGIEGVRCSPHTFRHTFSANFIRNGGDIYTLSKLLGHTTIKTTEEYLKSLTSRDARRRQFHTR